MSSRSRDSLDGALGSPKQNEMDDSVLTSPTVTDNGSISDEDGVGGWFGIGSDLKTFARSIKKTVPSAIDGIASAISRSAMAVAAEFSELERDAEQEAMRWREENYGTSLEDDNKELRLPWEIKKDGSSEDCVEDPALKEKILLLSKDENNFLTPFRMNAEPEISDKFVLDDGRIILIRRLLDMDEDLATLHARLSGRSDVKETLFWKNYFHHCRRVRAEHMEEEKNKMRRIGASGSSLGSLTPVAGEVDGPDEDTSFVIASPPASTNSVFSTHSFGDMVLVGGLDSLDIRKEGDSKR